MTKNDLIKKLQSVQGNPIILLSDAEFGLVELRNVELHKAHQSKSNLEEYVTDFQFNSESGLNTYFHDNYQKETRECIVFSL